MNENIKKAFEEFKEKTQVGDDPKDMLKAAMSDNTLEHNIQAMASTVGKTLAKRMFALMLDPSNAEIRGEIKAFSLMLESLTMALAYSNDLKNPIK